MEEKERIDQLLKMVEEKANKQLPLGFIVDTLFAVLQQTYERIPKNKSQEEVINFIFNTLLYSLISTCVCLGESEDYRKKILDLMTDGTTRKVIVKSIDEDEEQKIN